MGSIVWLIIAGVFALAELLTMDFSLLMLAISALMVAGVAVGDVPLWVEILTFAVSSILTLLLLRPVLKKRLLTQSDSHRFTHKELEGTTATVVEQISSSPGAKGMVSISGNYWTAEAAHPGETLTKGQAVRVLEIRGTTAVVWPEI